jgi:hypothetical protein
MRRLYANALPVQAELCTGSVVSLALVGSDSVVVVACVLPALPSVYVTVPCPICRACLRPVTIFVLWWDACTLCIGHGLQCHTRVPCIWYVVHDCLNLTYAILHRVNAPCFGSEVHRSVGTLLEFQCSSFGRCRHLLCLHVLRIPPHVVDVFVLFRLVM